MAQPQPDVPGQARQIQDIAARYREAAKGYNLKWYIGALHLVQLQGHLPQVFAAMRQRDARQLRNCILPDTPAAAPETLDEAELEAMSAQVLTPWSEFQDGMTAALDELAAIGVRLGCEITALDRQRRLVSKLPRGTSASADEMSRLRAGSEEVEVTIQALRRAEEAECRTKAISATNGGSALKALEPVHWRVLEFLCQPHQGCTAARNIKVAGFPSGQPADDKRARCRAILALLKAHGFIEKPYEGARTWRATDKGRAAWEERMRL